MTHTPHPPAPGAPAHSPHPSSADGDASLAALVPLVYRELRAIARRHLGAPAHARRGGGTLSTTALVNEAYLKLAVDPARTWRDRPHFLAVAAIAMRQILVDRARARAAL